MWVKLLVAGGALFGLNQYLKTKTAFPAENAKWGGVYDVVSQYRGGAKIGDKVPLVVLLHGQDSTPAEALGQFGLERPSLVVAPIGRHVSGVGRAFVDPKLLGDAYDKAMRDEVTTLAAAITHLLNDMASVPPRAIVVGLGASGALAATLGLAAPLQVRYAWGTGGAVRPAWVPLALPQLQNLPRPQVRKLSYGLGAAFDNAAAKLAEERGMDMRVTVMQAQPTTAQWQEWMMPELEPLVETP
jgi:hypothetical protein